LVGGETAEMPGMYNPGHYDLAGFCVGVVERAQLLDPAAVQPGDALVGIPSSGIHSNGYSLVRQLCDGLDWSKPHGLGEPLADTLMRPTRIYTPEVRTLLDGFEVHALVHITGGGFHENIPRALPEGCQALLDKGTWNLPPIFGLLQRLGALSDRDMETTFNNGVGMVAIVPQAQAQAAAAAVKGTVIGRVCQDLKQPVVVR
jgi:phosphoribosylformylglycinamidine cyclo-ligase